MRAEEIVGRCVDKFGVGIEVFTVEFRFAAPFESAACACGETTEPDALERSYGESDRRRWARRDARGGYRAR